MSMSIINFLHISVVWEVRKINESSSYFMFYFMFYFISSFPTSFQFCLHLFVCLSFILFLVIFIAMICFLFLVYLSLSTLLSLFTLLLFIFYYRLIVQHRAPAGLSFVRYIFSGDIFQPNLHLNCQILTFINSAAL